MERIILFDGICNLCNRSVQFIIKRDPHGCFKFASLQGETGQKLLKKHGLTSGINSFVLIENETIYLESTAALRVCRRLDRGWKLFAGFLIIPRPIRDIFYKIVANNRYKWFGKKNSCMLPLPEWKSRFLDE
ncbi:thiol-disulfide oxidoreductase DCC family protein [Neobacillus mesonae]|uniref:thiol-disulfide oxidoreductase DCC family protein n=1 Tax=Neobacillus mesonae TaxID=1193713 RepID=UPI00203E0738|nr:thiol-disulfide oxidoreductase DCC family protein [Neobacillus mesonae]MCM3567775.1 thiol-disulfide oxidoreductase DCC family protein [Neobacillus mesonae]